MTCAYPRCQALLPEDEAAAVDDGWVLIRRAGRSVLVACPAHGERFLKLTEQVLEKRLRTQKEG